MTIYSRTERLLMGYRENQDCLECRVKLLIYPGDINPKEITEILGVQPTSIGIKGEIAGPNSHGRIRINPCTTWFLISDEVLKSTKIEEHLDWMLEKLIQAKPGLDKIKKLPGVTIYFRCTWWTRTGGGFNFRSDQLKKLALLDLELEFDIAAYPDDKEADVEE